MHCIERCCHCCVGCGKPGGGHTSVGRSHSSMSVCMSVGVQPPPPIPTGSPMKRRNRVWGTCMRRTRRQADFHEEPPTGRAAKRYMRKQMYRGRRQKRTLLHMGCGHAGCTDQVNDNQEIGTIDSPTVGMVPRLDWLQCFTQPTWSGCTYEWA